jgi:hypothetical protein
LPSTSSQTPGSAAMISAFVWGIGWWIPLGR